MRKLFLLLFCVFVFKSFGQVSIPTIATTYSQNFNTLSDATTATNFTLTNWYSNKTTYKGSDGSSNSGGLYSFGTAAADRALGSLGSSSAAPIIYGSGFVNNTGSTITSITITYTGEMWRLGSALLDDRLFFSYNTLSTTWDDANNWNFASALDFQTPDASGTVDTKADGNVAPNKKTVSATVNISLPAASTLWIRWVDSNTTGSDCALAVDDFTISFSASSTPCTEPASNPSPITFSGVTSTNISGSFVANGATGYVVMYSTSAASIPTPVNGTTYSVGNFSGYSIASVGASTTFNVTTSPNTRLYFKVFAYNNTSCVAGPTYNTTATAFDTTTLNSTGIKDIVRGPSFNIYPNPAMSGRLVNIQFDEFVSGDISMRIVSLSGGIVEDKVVYMKNQNSLEINTANLAKGMYQIILQKGDAYSTNKLIIQ